MRPLKKKVSITLDEDVIEKIRLYAEETDRSFSQYINLLLRKHISAREARDEAKKRRVTQSERLYFDCINRFDFPKPVDNPPNLW